MTVITDKLLDELDAKASAATQGPRRHKFAYNNGGCPTADFYIPGHQGGASVEMMVADAEFICAADPQTVTALTAMVRKLRDEAQRHAEARATAEDDLERTRAKLEADLTEMTTKRREAQEQTGRYAALAAHDDAQARATLERHGMSEFHFGCDTLDHVCEALVAARDSTRVLIAETLDLKAERNQARDERDAYKKAKEENDERFMTERDDARAQRDAAKRHGEECAKALEQAHVTIRKLAHTADERMNALLIRAGGLVGEDHADVVERLLAERDKWQQNSLEQTQANDRERVSMQKRIDDLTPDAEHWRDAYDMLFEHLGARSEPALVCLRDVLTAYDAADARATVKQLQSDKDHLLDALDKDATGLAHALAAVMKVIEGRHWVTESRGAYEWNDERYKTETYSAFQAILQIVKPALVESGTRANDAWRTFERGRIVKLAAELGVLDGHVRKMLEGAHRHVTMWHHERCAAVPRINQMTAGTCDCGFNELRAAIKAQP